MMDVNKMILVGRLGADPEETVTASGKRRVHFPLATSRRFKGSAEDDALTQETLWHQIVVWGKSAEFCSQYLKKGDPAYIEGSLRMRKYEGKDGVQRMWTEVNVDFITSMGASRASSKPKAEAVPAEPAEAVH